MAYPFKLPELPYDYGALEPSIDERTMHIHHDKHHAGYTRKLNAALEDHSDLHDRSAKELLKDLSGVPSEIRTAVRNNGGGYVNHAMFWEIMSPDGGGEPGGALAQAIDNTFGSFSDFQDEFFSTAKGQFGSGWGWLVHDGGGLKVTSTPNQDSPLSDGLQPIMGVDVWEHAYYLKYQNGRGDYINNWWDVVDWDAVGERYARVSG